MEILLYQIPIKLSSPRQQFNPNVNRSAEFSGYTELAFSGSAFISDSTDGFYAVWSELINNGRQIKALRFNSDGKQLWKSPTVVASLKATQVYPDAVGDGEGGLVIVWQHYFAQKFYFDNIYAQRVDSTGSVRWGEYSVAICVAPGLEKSVWLADDGQGGVVAVWEDERDIYPDLYAQRISGAGKGLWGANGTPVCTSEGHQIRPLLIRSGSVGFSSFGRTIGKITGWSGRIRFTDRN